MRAAIATSLIVGILGLGLFLFVVVSRAAKREKDRRRERIELLTEVHALEDLLILIKNEVALQEQAGNDVIALRHILDSHPELTKELS